MMKNFPSLTTKFFTLNKQNITLTTLSRVLKLRFNEESYHIYLYSLKHLCPQRR